MNIIDDSVKNINISNIYIFINNHFKVIKTSKNHIQDARPH